MTRGYALPLVIALSLILSAVLGTLLATSAASVSLNDALVHRRQAFHAAEGVSLAALELVGEHLRALPSEPVGLSVGDPGYDAALLALLASNESDTETFINAAPQRALVAASGYTVNSLDVFGLGPARQQTLDSGPFRGMLGQVQPVGLRVSVSRDNPRTPATQTVTTEIERATVSMFQFYIFSDLYLDFDPGGVVASSGRIHTNQDFCVAGEPEIDRVTAAGRILMSNRAGHQCRRQNLARNDIEIAIDDLVPPTRRQLTQDAAQAGWLAFAAGFNGHVQDSISGNVQPLRMPISGRPRVQAGANVLAMEQVGGALPPVDRLVPIAAAREDNAAVGAQPASMRFLVDPMLVTEPADVRQQKFAFKADIRIIDGVWFVRDPGHPEQLGTMVWSDHPGLGNTMYSGNESARLITDQSGQEELRKPANLAWATTPQRFSYYGFEPDGANLRFARGGGSPRAVISYGTLKNDGGNVWSPGFYNNTSPLTVAKATTMEQFLLGARTGIKNGWLEVRSESVDAVTDGRTPVESGRARLLPINVDVAAFVAALKDCSADELGSYFPGTCLNGGGRRFNGVLFISSTWPGSLNGLGDNSGGDPSGFALLAPFNGTAGSGLFNTNLPMPLCVGAAAAPALTPSGGPALPGTFTAATLSRCSSVGRGAAEFPNGGNFPNVVRVFNAAHIHPPADTAYAGVTVAADALPGGLTIATNLPLIALGDTNTDTVPKRSKFVTPPGDYFVPFLLATDRFARHSVNWHDEAANWKDLMKTNARDGQLTVQNQEILAGWNPTPTTALAGHDHSSDGLEDFPRYNECWSDKAVSFGSTVIGFAAVYERAGANDAHVEADSAGYITCFPRREEGFDFHLEDPRNQPPGAPQLLASSVGFWHAN